MQVGRISGDNVRVHGKSQGYFGLPVRHSVVLDSATGSQSPCMETAWFPTPAEISAMLKGAPVIVRILGSVPPPMNVYTGDEPDGG